MSRVRPKDTSPEIRVRKAAHALGLRFRLHRSDLPGTPDLVFARHRAAIFVHGCFWHRHPNCKKATTPKSEVSFWTKKFERNVERDRKALEELSAAGWKTMVIWECQTTDARALSNLLKRFFVSPETDNGDSGVTIRAKRQDRASRRVRSRES